MADVGPPIYPTLVLPGRPRRGGGAVADHLRCPPTPSLAQTKCGWWARHGEHADRVAAPASQPSVDSTQGRPSSSAREERCTIARPSGRAPQSESPPETAWRAVNFGLHGIPRRGSELGAGPGRPPLSSSGVSAPTEAARRVSSRRRRMDAAEQSAQRLDCGALIIRRPVRSGSDHRNRGSQESAIVSPSKTYPKRPVKWQTLGQDEESTSSAHLHCGLASCRKECMPNASIDSLPCSLRAAHHLPRFRRPCSARLGVSA